MLLQEVGGTGPRAGRGGKGDAGTATGTAHPITRGKREMQSRSVTKSDFIALNTSTLDSVLASELEN